MPQMMPMLWVSMLLLTIIISFSLTTVLYFFLSTNKIFSKNTAYNKSPKNWIWKW